MRADRRMRYANLRHRGLAVADDPQDFDRPTFRIAAVELHELLRAPDLDELLRPLENEVRRKELANPSPVPRLNSAPELGHDLDRFHAAIIAVADEKRAGSA